MRAAVPSIETIFEQARACDVCAAALPHGPRPVFQLDPRARILVASQAPGRKVHESGTPFDDASGERLRQWMGLTRAQFYDAAQVAILPMGLCYPGTGSSGDLPPRRECAPRWRAPLLATLGRLRLTLAIGSYAIAWHLPGERHGLTAAVRNWRAHAPSVVPLPHPSPANNRWLARNRWFEQEVVPALARMVADALREPAAAAAPMRRAPVATRDGEIARAPRHRAA